MPGHVMLDLQGVVLTAEERDRLQHPQVGGVLLFTRNYASKDQLRHLVADIRLQSPNCLIAVDHEGGRVQRFRQEFIALPPFKEYGDLYQQDINKALAYAEEMANKMAGELRELDIDLSFAPVLDINSAKSLVIGDRSFHADSHIVIELGRAFIKGMHKAGMPATGKHFPGHGSVIDDSHFTLPVDLRHFDEIINNDIQPFLQLKSELDAIMPAHILYKNIDPQPPCFSSFWLQETLRKQVAFEGVIFSDDLSMAGAQFVTDYRDRADQALTAGCDMILVCNAPQEATRILNHLETYQHAGSHQRLQHFKDSVRHFEEIK